MAEIYVAGFHVEFLNGDNSYIVTIFYRNAANQLMPNTDKYSFSTEAKLKKFIGNTLLAPSEDAEPEAAA